MKLNLKDRTTKKLLNLPHGTEVQVSRRWRDAKKFKILYEARKLEFFKQVGRFLFVRTDSIL